MSFGSAASFSFAPRTASASTNGRSPLIRRANSPRFSTGSAARRSSHALCADFERCPAARHQFSTSAGISNGAYDQPSVSRAPLISSAPSGEPCDDDLPALVGAPKPMVVLHAIIVGLPDVLAFSIAAAMA